MLSSRTAVQERGGAWQVVDDARRGPAAILPGGAGLRPRDVPHAGRDGLGGGADQCSIHTRTRLSETLESYVYVYHGNQKQPQSDITSFLQWPVELLDTLKHEKTLDSTK